MYVGVEEWLHRVLNMSIDGDKLVISGQYDASIVLPPLWYTMWANIQLHMGFDSWEGLKVKA
jgi:hypothetical protein